MQEDYNLEKSSGKGKTYYQPDLASFLEFLEYRHWDLLQIGEFPDDYLLGDWLRYRIMLKYGIPLPGRSIM